MSANAVSMVGNQLTFLALPWFVLQTTGSAGRVGLAAAVEVVGIILSSFFSGALIDRIGFRRSSVLADCASGITIALIPLLDRLVGLAFWELLVLIFSVAIFNTPGGTARRSILPDLADGAGMGLERATSFDQAIRNFSLLAGPLAAGLLIASIAARNVLWVDAVTFGFSATVIAAFVPLPRTGPMFSGTSYLTEALQGVRFIMADRVILSMGLLGSYVNAVGAALVTVVLPVFGERVFHSSVSLGVMVAADGAGALIGTIVFGAVGHRWPRRASLFSAFMASFIGLLVLVPTPSLLISSAALSIDGLAFGVIGPLTYTIYQERIPAELRGRVLGTLFAVHRLAAPAGVILAGYAIQVFSLSSALAAVTGLSLLIPLMVLGAPALRSLGPPERVPIVAGDAGEL
ncbi:MAG: MFS transporter [Nitrolancea sp.]